MSSTPSSRTPARPRTAPRPRAWQVVLGAMLLLVALLAAAAATSGLWLRPLARYYVMTHAGRSFDCDEMTVRFHGSLDPTIAMRNLVIQNAPWAASKEPFIRARYAAGTISWRSLGSGMTVLELIVLEDAQVDMERQANGIRNWRLGHPDDTGPPRVRVLALDARRSTLHTIHAGIGLVADARIDDLPQARAAAGHPELPLTKRLVFDGSYQGHAFGVDTAVSDVLAFGAGARRFSLSGTARVGGWRLAADGTSTDVHALGDVDVQATLATDGNGPLWPLPAALASVRPIAAAGHLTKVDTTWTARGLHASLGRRTRLDGDGRFVGSLRDDTPRRTLQATLRDVVLDVDDLRALAGRPATSDDAPAAGAPMIPATPLRAERLRGLDADVDLADARILGAHDLAQSLRGHLTLAAGVLRVSGLDAGVAEGHVTGTAQFDGAQAPSTLSLDLAARGLRLDLLAPSLARNDSVSARVDAHARLQSHGDSPRALASSATGLVSAGLAPGASVSKRLDAKLSLDGGEWLRSLFDKSGRVAVECAALQLAVDRGVGTSRRFAFETGRTALAGHGTVNLAAETIDVTLTPARKTHALLALDKSIRARGPWRDVKIALEPPVEGVEPARCVAPAAAAASR